MAEKQRVVCPGCGLGYQLTGEQVEKFTGKSFACKKCGTKVPVGPQQSTPPEPVFEQPIYQSASTTTVPDYATQKSAERGFSIIDLLVIDRLIMGPVANGLYIVAWIASVVFGGYAMIEMSGGRRSPEFLEYVSVGAVFFLLIPITLRIQFELFVGVYKNNKMLEKLMRERDIQ
jgi:hypothetical protein